MKIEYLGTAAAEGLPALFCECDVCTKAKKLGGKNVRTRSQSLIDNSLLIDFPADTYLHALHGGLSLSEIQSVLITHTHSDHFYPEDFMMRIEPYGHLPTVSVMHIYGNSTAHAHFLVCAEGENRDAVRAALQFHQVTPYIPFITPDGYTVTALLALHNRNEECFIYMIQKEGKSLLYAHDTGFFPEETLQHIKGHCFDLISLDCTQGKYPDGKNHMGLLDNFRMMTELRSIGSANEHTRFVANHFSHNGDLLHDELVSIAEKENLIISYDGMTLNF